jgi:hypothetical protein
MAFLQDPLIGVHDEQLDPIRPLRDRRDALPK